LTSRCVCWTFIATVLKSLTVTSSDGLPWKSCPKTFCVYCSSSTLVVACQRYKQLNLWRINGKLVCKGQALTHTSTLHTLPFPRSKREWSEFRISYRIVSRCKCMMHSGQTTDIEWGQTPATTVAYKAEDSREVIREHD